MNDRNDGTAPAHLPDLEANRACIQPDIGMPRHRWMLDWANPWEYTAHALRREIYHAQSEFQDIEIVETEGYGRCLLLDGEVQSFEADEYIYHEALVHPPMLLHPNPRHVLVIGGGEGATLREVLRHRSVESAIMVDLDEQLIAAARDYLPTFHQGSFDDHRAQIKFNDGRRFVETSQDQFDVIIIDVTNPMQTGPSCRLFTVEFYRSVRQRLRSGGVVSLQSDAVTLHGLESAATIYNTVRATWPHVFTYAVFLPAYTTDWSFTICSKDPIDPLSMRSDEIDRRLQDRLTSPLRFYDGVSHQRLFHLPRYVRGFFAAHRRISSDAQPLCESFPGLSSTP